MEMYFGFIALLPRFFCKYLEKMVGELDIKYSQVLMYFCVTNFPYFAVGSCRTTLIYEGARNKIADELPKTISRPQAPINNYFIDLNIILGTLFGYIIWSMLLSNLCAISISIFFI